MSFIPGHVHARPLSFFWGWGIAALTVTVLVLSSTTSYAIHARVASEFWTASAWTSYRPWRLGAGWGRGRVEPAGSPNALGGRCFHTTTRGSAPWVTWNVVVSACVCAPPLHPHLPEDL